MKIIQKLFRHIRSRQGHTHFLAKIKTGYSKEKFLHKIVYDLEKFSKIFLASLIRLRGVTEPRHVLNFILNDIFQYFQKSFRVDM